MVSREGDTVGSGRLERTICIREVSRIWRVGEKSQIQFQVFSEMGRTAESMGMGVAIFYQDMKIPQSEEPTSYR